MNATARRKRVCKEDSQTIKTFEVKCAFFYVNGTLTKYLADGTEDKNTFVYSAAIMLNHAADLLAKDSIHSVELCAMSIAHLADILRDDLRLEKYLPRCTHCDNRFEQKWTSEYNIQYCPWCGKPAVSQGGKA